MWKLGGIPVWVTPLPNISPKSISPIIMTMVLIVEKAAWAKTS